MPQLTTTVRDAQGRLLFRMSGRQPKDVILTAAEEHAVVLAEALHSRQSWQVTTQRGSTPAKSFEELHNG